MLCPRLRHRRQLDLEGAEPKRLGEGEGHERQGAADDPDQRAVGPHGTAVRIGEPVEGDHGQDRLQG